MNKAALWLSSIFWLVMMALLVHVDVIPANTVVDSPDYGAVLQDVETPVMREMAVFQGDEEVGRSQTIITPAPDGSCRMVNMTNLTVRVAMFESRVSAVLEVYIDAAKQLDRLTLKVNAAENNADVTGVRVGDKLRLSINLNGQVISEEVPYEDAMVSSYFEPFALGSRIKVGQEWKTQFLDPISQGTTAATVKVVSRENIEIELVEGQGPRSIEAYHIVMTWQDMVLNAWATDDGTILKEETPWGYTLVYRETGSDDRTERSVEDLRDQAGG